MRKPYRFVNERDVVIDVVEVEDVRVGGHIRDEDLMPEDALHRVVQRLQVPEKVDRRPADRRPDVVQLPVERAGSEAAAAGIEFTRGGLAVLLRVRRDRLGLLHLREEHERRELLLSGSYVLTRHSIQQCLYEYSTCTCKVHRSIRYYSFAQSNRIVLSSA